MNILEIIEKKREKKELTKEEIEYFINGYVKEEIADYQIAALVMAIFLNGMTKQETTNLTIAMANSGEILDLSKLNKIIVDKHSTGGVGDKVSICLLPLVASIGVPVAKMSGRGLGFTGGTVDKMQSIPGYKTDIDINSFIQNVENIGISMISQTMNLAPADKKLYALRDSISCVESIPLIASSIMSKKIASGAEKIVLDNLDSSIDELKYTSIISVGHIVRIDKRISFDIINKLELLKNSGQFLGAISDVFDDINLFCDK